MVALGNPQSVATRSCDFDGKDLTNLDGSLERAMRSVKGTTNSVILQGNPYSGKTLAQRRIRKKLGLHEDETPHNEITRMQLTEDEVSKIKDGLSKGIILEGSPYQIDYILRGDPFDDLSNDESGIREKIKSWYQRKLKKEEPSTLPPNFAPVDAWLSKDDALALFDYFAETIEKTHPNSQVHTKNELTKKRDRFISLASWGGAPSNEQMKGGMLLPPLLRECMEKYAAKSDSELAQMESIERTRERLMASFFGFTVLEAGINTVNFMNVAKEVATTLVAASPIFSLASIVLSSTSAILGFAKDGKAVGYGKYVEAYKSWNELSLEKRRLLGDRLDEQNRLAPGSSYAFLNDWLSGSKGDRESEKEFKTKLETTFTDPFIGELRSMVSKIEDVKKKVEEDSEKINSLVASLERMEKELDKLREDLYALGTKRISDEAELRAWLGIPAEERTKVLVGLMDNDMTEADREVQHIVSQVIEGATDRISVLTGEPGSGKSTVMFLAGRSILASGKKLYYIEYPANFNPSMFKEIPDSYAIVDFNRADPAIDFFSKTLRPEGKVERKFCRIIISLRGGFLGQEEKDQIQDEKMFSHLELQLNKLVLKEVGFRAVASSLPGLSEDEVDKIVGVLVSKAEGHPLYITEAVKLIASEMRSSQKFEEKMLDQLPSGIKDLVIDILKQEERRDPNLLITYHLVSQSRGLLKEHLEAFNHIYGIEEPRFLDESPDGKLSLHFWYRDMVPLVVSNGSRKGMISFNSETMLGGYFRDIDEILSKKLNDLPPALSKPYLDFKRHKASARFVDLADLVMFGATIYLADTKLLKKDGSQYGFNILEERIEYGQLSTEGAHHYHRLYGFLINGYLSGDALAEALSGEMRPFYYIHALFVNRFSSDEIAFKIDQEFISGRGSGIDVKEMWRISTNSPHPTKVYNASVFRIFEKIGHLRNVSGLNRYYGFCIKMEYQSAIDEYDKAIMSNPYNPRHHSHKGHALRDLSRYEEAIREYDLAIELAPFNPTHHVNKGNALIDLGRYEEAIKEYNHALKLEPNEPLYHCNKGIALDALGKHEEAIKEYDYAIDLEPNDPSYHRRKGNALNALGRYEEAIKEDDRAIELQPNHPGHYNSKGTVLDNLGKHEEAIKEYDCAIDLEPNNHVYHCNKGIALDALGKHEEAIKEYDYAIDLEPNDPIQHGNKSIILFELGMYAEAIKECDRAIELRPNHSDYHYGKGEALNRLGRYEEAIAEYDCAIELAPNDPDIHNNKADALLALGKNAESMEERRLAETLEKMNTNES